MELPDTAPTGEIFLMCSPKDRLREIWDPAQRMSQHHYEVLCQTIARCGGELVLDRAIKPNLLGYRHGMFPRDVGIVLPKHGVPTLFTPEHYGVAGKRETRQASKHAQRRGIAQETIPGRVDGGNLVYDATRQLLFVGVNNYNHVKYLSEFAWRQEDDGTGRMVWTPHDPIENVPEHNKQRYVMDRIRHAKPNAKWLKAAPDALAGVGMPQGTTVRVVPLFMPDRAVDEHFHLDGVFNMLPTGQAVICPSQLSKAALHLVEKHIGRDNLIPISNEEANRDAANFITVGSHIITPFASAALKETFTALGYTVIDPPAVGLEAGAWGFTQSGAVRCATLKLTPDLGFPGAEKNRGTGAAASLHQRS